MRINGFRQMSLAVITLAFLSSCKVTRITEVHNHYGNSSAEVPITKPIEDPVKDVIEDPVYYDKPIVYKGQPANNNTVNNDPDNYVFDETTVDDYDYYYSARIRRFHRPYRGFNYYSNVYTDYYYYDPYYSGTTIYVVNDYWGPRRNFWNWSGPYAYVGTGWGWGAGWHSGWGAYWGPGQYYGWNCRPNWHHYHYHNHWGNNWGWNHGYGHGYNNGYWAGYYNGYHDGFHGGWWRSAANPGTISPDRDSYNGRHGRTGGRLASNESPTVLGNVRTSDPNPTIGNTNVNVRPTATSNNGSIDAATNSVRGSGNSNNGIGTADPGRNSGIANTNPSGTGNPTRGNEPVISSNNDGRTTAPTVQPNGNVRTAPNNNGISTNPGRTEAPQIRNNNVVRPDDTYSNGRPDSRPDSRPDNRVNQGNLHNNADRNADNNADRNADRNADKNANSRSNNSIVRPSENNRSNSYSAPRTEYRSSAPQNSGRSTGGHSGYNSHSGFGSSGGRSSGGFNSGIRGR
jgi:hypothetical protein